MKVLITGGAGFIGSHYVDGFVDAGHEVTVFDIAPPKHESRSKFVVGDLQDAEAIRKAVAGADLVVHAAGLLGTHETVTAAGQTSRINIIGSLNVLDAVKESRCKLISISKPNVWLNPYSITKDSMEKFCFMYVNEFDIDVVVLKLYNVYGTRQKYSHVRKAIPTWIVDALNDKPVEIFGSGEATVDLIHTRDVIEGTLAIVDNFDKCKIKKRSDIAENVYSSFPGYNEQVLELGSGSDVTVNHTVGVLRKALGIDVKVTHLPMRRGEVDRTRLCADLSRLTQLTHFAPKVSLQQGIRETIDYYRERLPLVAAGEL